VHITLSVDPNLPSLRRPDLTECIEDCLREIRDARTDFRVVHYSIQRHHLHLVVEAANRQALSRGMRGLAIRVARRINKVLGRRGKVFVDRYFETVVKSPRQAKNCLCYVLLNTQRHLAQSGQSCEPGWIDPASSGRYFDGWRGRPPPPPEPDRPVSEPHTWLLSRGWRRHGLVPLDTVPGTRARRPGLRAPGTRTT
jgi:REP element-mobilizing transposase RayT